MTRYINMIDANKVAALSDNPSMPFGEKILFPDNTEYQFVYWDGASPSSVTLGDVLFVDANGGTATYTTTPRVDAVATSSIVQHIGIATATLSAAGGFYVQTRGLCPSVNVLGSSYDTGAGQNLIAINGQKYLTDVGSASYARTVKTVGWTTQAYTTASAAVIPVVLCGDMAQV